MKKVTLGIIGCGAIAPAYVKNFNTYVKDMVTVKACADIIPVRAQKLAQDHHIPVVCSVTELLADPEIEVVINLTNAWAHYSVSMAVLNAGKHLFTEKALASTLAEGQELVSTAHHKGLLLAGAPDIFLGASLQKCRQLIEQQVVGRLTMAHGLIGLTYRGPLWHRTATGVLMDMGPYYLTALAVLLGPIQQVNGAVRITLAEKTEEGVTFPVEVPQAASASLLLANGVVASLMACGEAGEGYIPRLEFFGTGGTLQASDPNMYCRPVILRQHNGGEVKVDHGFKAEGRGLGVAEMAWALREGRQARASGDLMLHVLDAIQSVYASSTSGKTVLVHTPCPRPEPFDLDAMYAAFGVSPQNQKNKLPS